MSKMVARPAEDMLPYAEQQRFTRISEGARSAAERLVCFALPFQRRDAEEIFPDYNIGLAIRELLAQGLLRPLDENSFEMHETIRAGLEQAISLNVRHSTHSALAAWYARQGFVPAEILHLDKADRHSEACERARDAFLRGRYWTALAAYVRDHKLISKHEVIRLVAEPGVIEDRYYLSRILRGLGVPIEVEELIQLTRAQRERFHSDGNWALAVTEAILEFEPARLHDLLVWLVETTRDTVRLESALGWLMVAAQRKNSVIGPAAVDFFTRQQPEVKRLLLPFMLLDWRRDVLQHAFRFLAADQELPGEQGRAPFWGRFSLRIKTQNDTVEFLAAIPAIEPAKMLIAKSPLLGPLANPVWSQRTALRAHCTEILKNFTMEETVLAGAIRVLISLAEPSICTLCEPLLLRKDAIGVFAAFVPALVPEFCDRAHFEHRVLDRSAGTEERMTALSVLASVGADLGDIYRRMNLIEGSSESKGWNSLFLALCSRAPFPDAIPLLDRQLKAPDENSINLIAPILMKLGELTTPDATGMLIRALSHANPRIRQCASIGLTQRRSRRALAPLIEQFERENDEALTVSLATAIVASGARSIADIRSNRHDSFATQLWRCILAMRLREASFADQLVTIACDPAQNWQLRRAAIFAAGRMPYEAALERIVSPVMSERSPLTIDGSPNLCCHAVISSILLTCAGGMLPHFVQGKARFIEFHGEIFEECLKRWTFSQGRPTGDDAAGWLFDRLTSHGWSSTREAPDLIINELHIPILHSAVLRSLRLSARPDLIEQQIPHAYHVWFAMKCLMERSWTGRRDPQLASQLTTLVEASPCGGEVRLHQVISEICGTGVTEAQAPTTPIPSQNATTPPTTYLSYQDAVRALSGATPDFKPTMPLLLEPVEAEQFEHLVRLANPANDYAWGTETYIPSVSFREHGYVVAQRQMTYKGESLSSLIRPVIAAANRFGLCIPWHQDLLSGMLANTYAPRLLECLGAQNDDNRFYEEVAKNADVLIPQICRSGQVTTILKYVDERIVPYLSRYISSGTDEFFEGLCALAQRVTTPAIDDILSGLFYRWTQRFDPGSPGLQHDQNHKLWQGFNRLAEHERFGKIEAWSSRLASVLRTPISWYHSQSIVRVLERDPRSYIQIECLLFRAESWEHFHRDEIDRLDDAAERLFSQLLEE
jgi:hypothetical protein